MKYIASNWRLLDKRVLPMLTKTHMEYQPRDTVLLFIILCNFELKHEPMFIEHLIYDKLLLQDNFEEILTYIPKFVINENLNIQEMKQIIRFLNLIHGCKNSLESIENFFSDYFGLTICLRMSK